MLPPTVGFTVQIVKGTSVASLIGLTELARTATVINTVTFEPALVFGTVALIYFALCWPLSLLGACARAAPACPEACAPARSARARRPRRPPPSPGPTDAQPAKGTSGRPVAPRPSMAKRPPGLVWPRERRFVPAERRRGHIEHVEIGAAELAAGRQVEGQIDGRDPLAGRIIGEDLALEGDGQPVVAGAVDGRAIDDESVRRQVEKSRRLATSPVAASKS